MKKLNLDVFSDALDNEVIRLPGTELLSSVIQGGELFLLHADAMDILEELKHNPGSNAYYKAHSVVKNLENRLDHFIAVCRRNDIEIGFQIEYSVYDYDDPL